MDGYLTETQCAKALGLQPSTLRVWRRKGIAPAYSKVGYKVYYREGALHEFMLAKEVTPIKAKRR